VDRSAYFYWRLYNAGYRLTISANSGGTVCAPPVSHPGVLDDATDCGRPTDAKPVQLLRADDNRAAACRHARAVVADRCTMGRCDAVHTVERQFGGRTARAVVSSGQ